ncbi:MAG: hypothetical protein JWL62_3210 [Hyphomicrobiales bacterium]|nr:hypothetical protein [Hyphomicrobiales bacterium]
MKPRTNCFWLTACVVLLPAAAGAKDLNTLARILYAAFAAEQSAVICSSSHPNFNRETAGKAGDMRAYAQHIKLEVTEGLNETDTDLVLKAAAGRARAETSEQLQNLRSDSPSAEALALSRWCMTIATKLVRQVIATHDEHHTEIDQMMAKSKQE